MPVSTAIDLLSPEIEAIQSSEFYEAAISADETIISNYWYLGLSYLLAGREEDAQAIWFVPFAEADEVIVELYTDELLSILDRSADNCSKSEDLENAWLIRQHIWLLKPEHLENILHSISLANSLDLLTGEMLVEWQIEELLEIETVGSIDEQLLEAAIAALVQTLRIELSLKVIKSCLNLVSEDTKNIICRKLIITAFQLFHQHSAFAFSVRLAEICKELSPDYLDIYHIISSMYSQVDLHHQSIENAEYYYQQVQNAIDKLFGSYTVQRSCLTAGSWNGYLARTTEHHQLINNAIADLSINPREFPLKTLVAASFFSPYLEDNPRVNRPLQNQVARIYQDNIRQITLKSDIESVNLAKKTGILRIGYLASTLKKHSVGWLSRWLFQYHDLESFQIFIYCVNQTPDDPFNHQWFRDKANISYYFDNNFKEVVTQIREDEIDILIDLDSLTFDTICTVMAYKPAPVQATWLGWDASGIPAIDYYIVDPYVVPDDAQDYYQEQLWRLPQTYLAVDGFEVGIPTLNRQNLDIPDDAIVYFSSQNGYKRHPDNIRAQIRIIKAVPNSYLLIKGKSDPEMIRDLFGTICEQEGISLDRLRFLAGVPDETTHRANLAIADIVLDTFPYNGATTTLETLWMGIPMVTRVGTQFAARNSYTFMLNAGIEEGIAWSEAEYIDWGIKLGLDRELRWKIQGKLRSGRTTAPVWNAKQFTLDMEAAYRGMWAKYQEGLNNRPIDLHENN
jgi:predicted O-linked N-acetylglucosamine transferase (SPINDLY family)